MEDMNVILIDSGTTNSRIRLIVKKTGEIKDLQKVSIGVRNTAIEGNNENLKKQLNEGIKQLLERNQLSPSEIKYIVASGMITSNLGIYEIPHVTTPASINDFVEHSRIIKLEEFFNIPCIFIPGMKNQVNENLDTVDFINQFDVMRGEEVEAFGLLKQLNVKGKGIMVLPGSHTKYVVVDENQTLTSCLSTLGGETLLAMQKETILSDSLDQQLIEDINVEMLEKGYAAAKQYGLTRSFYHIRLLQLFSKLDANQRANYFVGAVIYDDIQTLLHSIADIGEMEWIVVGGADPLKKVFTHLLKHLKNDWRIIEANNQQVEHSLVFGAQEVANKYLSKTN